MTRRPVSGARLAVALCVLALLASRSGGAWSDEWGMSQLMEELARHKSGQAHFVEKRFLSVLDAPLVSSGDLSFTAPDRLEKRTLQPKPELVQLDGDSVTIDRGRQHLSFGLDEHPELGALIESLRATLNGNRQALERNYSLTLSGRRERWQLALVPNDARVAALVAHLNLNGSNGRVLGVEYIEPNGDRSMMTIEPVESE